MQCRFLFLEKKCICLGDGIRWYFMYSDLIVRQKKLNGVWLDNIFRAIQ